ncbi:MAG: NADH-quinone oxidoreductase subunit H [Clostridia bacterium]|nr:NADH-quinone oxidoreductase subunit H [Clostridia bacterium]
MNILTGIIYLIVAPFAGGLLAGIDRKITARMQGRQGPPILQPFYDVAKLFTKQNAVVNASQNVFIFFYLFFNVFTGFLFFSGQDVLLVTFALTLSGIFLVLCAYTVNSPFSSMGASRELAQIMSYEPAVMLSAVGFYMVKDSFSVAEIVGGNLPNVIYLPGVFAVFLYILTIKLRKSPFDISTSHHAHQEIVKGVTTEISGPSLGIIEITHWYETILIWGFVYLFFGFDSVWSLPIFAVAFVIIFLMEILIDNSSARVKWQGMFKTSWFLTATIAFLNLLVISIFM